MKRETLFLKLAIGIIGFIILALDIFALPLIVYEAISYFPKFSVYGAFSAIFITNIPFFFALFQTLKLLSYIDHNKAFSDLSVKALMNIKISAITISGLYVLSLPFLFYMADFDDAPGIIVIGLFFIFASFIVAVFAAVLEKLLKRAIDIQSENELTI